MQLQRKGRLLDGRPRNRSRNRSGGVRSTDCGVSVTDCKWCELLPEPRIVPCAVVRDVAAGGGEQLHPAHAEVLWRRPQVRLPGPAQQQPEPRTGGRPRRRRRR